MTSQSLNRPCGVDGIRIVDVIAKPYATWNNTLVYYIVVDRMPANVYVRDGLRLTSHDDGFYDFLQIDPGTTRAFAGRTFDIALADGSTYHATGDVWSVAPPPESEPTIQVGIATLAKLADCYVFAGSHVSRSKLEAWLRSNVPSNDYYKYDDRSTVAWAAAHRDLGARTVCANRARKLRRRGVEVWRDANGRRLWSPWYERRCKEITARRAADPGSVCALAAVEGQQ